MPTSPDWDLVRRAEGPRAPLADRVASELERGRRDYAPPEVGSDVVSDKVRRVQEDAYNRARLERIADVVLPGEELVEVGCGAGFVAARALAAGAASYRAMDLEASCVRRTGRLLDALGHEDRVRSIVETDLYTLEPGDLDDASLVICSEVVEHVPDPELALETLGRALPEDADLLFTVPLLGRLEQVWGHLSIFTAERLQSMLERAGLEALLVEPLADRWVLVVAGHPGGSQRRTARVEQLLAAGSRHPEVTRDEASPATPPQPTRFDNVPLGSLDVSAVSSSRAAVEVTPPTPDEGSAAATVTAAGSPLPWRRATGGLALSLADVDPVQGVRLELEVDSLADVTAVTVTFPGAASGRSATWTWSPSRRDVQSHRRRTFSLRPGRSITPFAAPRSADLTGARRVEVTLTVRPGRTAHLDLSRIAWIR